MGWLTAPIFGSYGRAWDFETLSKERAMWLMGGDTSLEAYEASGKEKAALIAQYLSPGDKVLEIGCGMGRIMKQLAPSCGELHGVDVSSRVLRMARRYMEKVPNVVLGRVNGHDLKAYDSETFDFAYAIQVLSTMRREDALRYLGEMHRILKPGGGILVHFVSLEHPNMAAEYRDYAMGSTMLKITRRRYYTAGEVRIVAEISGFSQTSVKTEGDAHWLHAIKAPVSVMREAK